MCPRMSQAMKVHMGHGTLKGCLKGGLKDTSQGREVLGQAMAVLDIFVLGMAHDVCTHFPI